VKFKEYIKENYSGNLKRIKKIFNKYKIEYMFIGRGSDIMQGFNETTQDIDIYPNNNINNNKKILLALKELKFNITSTIEHDILKGKDFIQFDNPFEFDIVFSPDGFNNYKDATKYRKNIDGYPVMSIKGIIKSKEATGRPKDKLSLPTLKDFDKFLNKTNKEYIGNLFEVVNGYEYTDYQTINRWQNNINKYTVEERFNKGFR
jgi:hypothetical protein